MCYLMTIQNVLTYDNYVCIRALTIQNVSPEKKNILSCTATTAVIGYEIRYLDLQVLFHIITTLIYHY